MSLQPIVRVHYKGGLRTLAVHLLSNQEIITDAPIDNHGKGESFSPTDLVAASWMACMFTIMGIAMKTHDFHADMHGEVIKVMYSEPRRIGELHATVTVKGFLNEKQKAILENAAKNCPVAKSLSSDMIQNIHFEYV